MGLTDFIDVQISIVQKRDSKKFWSNNNKHLRISEDMVKNAYNSVNLLFRSFSVEGQISWIIAPTRFPSAKDFVDSNEVRIHALSTAFRTSRFKAHDRVRSVRGARFQDN